MVHKRKSSPPSDSRWFENDVKMYGTQALPESLSVLGWFENDVKMYGTQAEEKKY